MAAFIKLTEGFNERVRSFYVRVGAITQLEHDKGKTKIYTIGKQDLSCNETPEEISRLESLSGSCVTLPRFIEIKRWPSINPNHPDAGKTHFICTDHIISFNKGFSDYKGQPVVDVHMIAITVKAGATLESFIAQQNPPQP